MSQIIRALDMDALLGRVSFRSISSMPEASSGGKVRSTARIKTSLRSLEARRNKDLSDASMP
eukprot:10987744-Prorocentrum_lima.AAC.1